MRNRGGNHHALKVFIVLALSLCVAALRPTDQAAPANAEMRNRNRERGLLGGVPEPVKWIAGTILAMTLLENGIGRDALAMAPLRNKLQTGLHQLQTGLHYARAGFLRMARTSQEKKQTIEDLEAPVNWQVDRAVSFLAELSDIERNRLAEVWRDEVTNQYSSTYGFLFHQKVEETDDAFKGRVEKLLLDRLLVDQVPAQLAEEMVEHITATAWRLHEVEERHYDSSIAVHPTQPSVGYLFYDIGVVCKPVGPAGTQSIGVAVEVAGFNYDIYRSSKTIETVTRRTPRYEIKTEETQENGWLLFSWPVNRTREVRVQDEVTSEQRELLKSRKLNTLELDELSRAAVWAIKDKTLKLQAPDDSIGKTLY